MSALMASVVATQQQMSQSLAAVQGNLTASAPKVAPIKLSLSPPKENCSPQVLHHWLDLTVEKVKSCQQDPSVPGTAAWLSTAFSDSLNQ